MNDGKRFSCYGVFFMLQDIVFYGIQSKITGYILYIIYIGCTGMRYTLVLPSKLPLYQPFYTCAWALPDNNLGAKLVLFSKIHV